MLIIDSHVHIFKSFSGIKNGQPVVSEEYGKIKTGNTISQFLLPSFEKTDSTMEMLIAHMDCYGIEKAVVLPNIFYGYHNDYNLEAVRKYPDRLKALALVDVTKGYAAAEELDGLLKKREFRGLKIEVESAFQFRPRMMLDDKELTPIWEVCDQNKSIVMLHLLIPENIKSMKHIIKNYKNIKYIFCHLGAEAAFCNANSGEERKELTNIVKENSNVWYEASTMPCYLNDEYYPFISGSKYLEEVYKIVGAEKIIWGSDYPGMLPRGTYKQLIDYILADCKKIPEKHKAMIMGSNAQELFFG